MYILISLINIISFIIFYFITIIEKNNVDLVKLLLEGIYCIHTYTHTHIYIYIYISNSYYLF